VRSCEQSGKTAGDEVRGRGGPDSESDWNASPCGSALRGPIVVDLHTWKWIMLSLNHSFMCVRARACARACVTKLSNIKPKRPIATNLNVRRRLNAIEGPVRGDLEGFLGTH
jgi:hypothetical protein